jgi:hypothetical protein
MFPIFGVARAAVVDLLELARAPFGREVRELR